MQRPPNRPIWQIQSFLRKRTEKSVFWGVGGALGPNLTVMLVSGNKSIHLHRSGPLLENGLDRPESCYGRYIFASFPSISIFIIGIDGVRVPL